MKDTEQDAIEFDTSPVDAWVGVPLGGGQMKDPVAPNDIRRWAQGMQNCNPLYYDENFAEAGESFHELALIAISHFHTDHAADLPALLKLDAWC